MKSSIYGENVVLRPLCEEDAEFFAHWYSAPEIMFECGFYEPTTPEAERKRIRRPEGADEDWYAVTDKKTGRLLGETGLLRMWRHWRCTDMSMMIPNPDDQGKGYGAEAGRLMLERAFRHYNMNRVSVGVVKLNVPAVKYWERLGFKEEGIQEQGYLHNGEFSDFIMMRILKSEYGQDVH
ncbi:MAG: GNAT family N-acetyltransferase [Oscillospiraceae bacterium]|nr:GNAT family N-acetyltransferase [Oscillospiraceae bacterium]